MNNILITSAGRRVSLVKSFKQEVKNLELESHVYCTDLNPSLSSACQIADCAFKVPRVTDSNYIDYILEICQNHNIRMIIPTIDTELAILAENRKIFKKRGTYVIVSNIDFIHKCRDKRLIHEFFDSIELERAQELIKEKLKFPVFVKPVDGSRSVGIHLIKEPNELTSDILSNPKNMFLEYFSPKEYQEFTVDIYFNKDSKILSIVPRERLVVRDGEVNKACTRKNEIVNLILNKFKNVDGLRGCITLQVFKHKSSSRVIGIEINPRFGGGYPLSYLAGANFPKWLIEEYIRNEKVEEYRCDWADNLLMLRYDAEVISYGYKG